MSPPAAAHALRSRILLPRSQWLPREPTSASKVGASSPDADGPGPLPPLYVTRASPSARKSFPAAPRPSLSPLYVALFVSRKERPSYLSRSPNSGRRRPSEMSKATASIRHPQGCSPAGQCGRGDRLMNLLPAVVKQKFILSPGQMLTHHAED